VLPGAIFFESPMSLTPVQLARLGLAALVTWEIALHAILWTILAEKPPATDDNPTLIVGYVALAFALPLTVWALGRFLVQSAATWPNKANGSSAKTD
jgi:hypothetical protein